MKRKLNNADIRQECKQAGVYLWQIAEYLDVCDMTLSRKMRKELPPEEKALLREAIAAVKAGV